MKSIVVTLALAFPFLGSYGVTMPAIAAEAALEVAQVSTALQGEWVLLGWGDAADLTPPVAGTQVTANFMGDRLFGSTGCNNYTTSFTTDGATLELGPTATTMKACADPISQQESQFLMALSGVQTYVITPEGHLHLTYETEAGSGVLAFVPLATYQGPAQEAIPALW